MADILCGPIVRRTTTSEVYVWIATEEDIRLEGEIRDRTGQTTLGVDDGTRKVQLGDKFFVHLIRIRPDGARAFETDTILCYDIYKVDGSQRTSLLSKDKEVRYDNEVLPGFVIPSRLHTILHGSCRKPHAVAVKGSWGNADQLATGDDLLADTIRDEHIGNRPSMLLLTGDQIYADDVGGSMLDHLIRLGNRLTGWDEIIPRRRPPVDDHGLHTRDDHECAAKIKLYNRSAALSPDWTDITSTAKDNHLLTFGEYAGMHLTVWGGPGARPDLHDWQAIEDRINRRITPRDYELDRQRTKEFCATLVKVRRLLANITVYMVLDDHEVTDDWNISPDWARDVHKSPRGRRTVANALAASWACQSWGNNPEAFDQSFIDTLTAHLAIREFRDNGAEATRFDERLWESKADRWAYTIPSEPPIIALDTRTCRQLEGQVPKPVKLMNQAALDWLKSALTDAAAGVTAGNAFHICLASATPVLGFNAIENTQKVLSGLGFSSAALDNESWVSGLPELMQSITSTNPSPNSLSVFSGDVHYSFARRARLTYEGTTVDTLQLTSSPLHNEPLIFLKVRDRDVLVRKHGFIPSKEKDNQNQPIDITTINNIARVTFDANGRAQGQQLISRLPNDSYNRVTFHISNQSEIPVLKIK